MRKLFYILIILFFVAVPFFNPQPTYALDVCDQNNLITTFDVSPSSTTEKSSTNFTFTIQGPANKSYRMKVLSNENNLAQVYSTDFTFSSGGSKTLSLSPSTLVNSTPGNYFSYNYQAFVVDNNNFECTVRRNFQILAEQVDCTLTANPKNIILGESATLTMTTSGPVNTATLDGNAVAKSGGTKKVTPTTTGEIPYRGSVTGGADNATENCLTFVSVSPKPATVPGDNTSGGGNDTSTGTGSPDGSFLSRIEDLAFGPNFNFKDATLGTIVQKAIPWIFGSAGIGLLLYLIYGGFHLMTSGGEPKAMQEAKGKITNALVGFIIIFVAYWIVQIVGRVFGLTGITDIFQ